MILAGSSVYWTQEVITAIKKGGDKALHEYVHEILNPQLQQIVMLVRGKLSKLQMGTLGELRPPPPSSSTTTATAAAAAAAAATTIIHHYDTSSVQTWPSQSRRAGGH